MDRRLWMVGGVLLAAVLLWLVAVPMGSSTKDSDAQPNSIEGAPMAPPTEPKAAAKQEVAAQAEPRPALPQQKPAPGTAVTTAAKAPSAPVAATAQNVPAPQRAGPVDKFKQAFESEPRSSDARNVESKIEAAFRQPDVPAGLLKSVLCRQSVCRVAVNWSPDRAMGYMAAAMRLVTDFGPEMAFDPVGEVDAERRQEVHFYFARRDPSAAPAR